MPSGVAGNVPKLSLPSTGTVDGATVGVTVPVACPGAGGDDDEALVQALARTATPAATMPLPARTRSFPAPMGLLAFSPAAGSPNFRQWPATTPVSDQ